MPKIRGIKPETWTDDKFVRLTPLARLLFIGMWNYACDNGHLEDNAIQLKIRLLPIDNCDIASLVDELIETGQVERHDGYLKVIKLPEHQHIDMRWLTLCEWCAHDEHKTFTPAQKKPRKPSARSAPNERKTSTPRAQDADGDGDGDGELKVTPSASAEAFDEFWAIYPRKEGKGAARKAWAKATKTLEPSELIAAVIAYAERTTGAEKRFIPHPTTWLNQERWADEPDGDDTDASADEWFQPFTLPECPAEIADDPARYATWVDEQRALWQGGAR